MKNDGFRETTDSDIDFSLSLLKANLDSLPGDTRDLNYNKWLSETMRAISAKTIAMALHDKSLEPLLRAELETNAIRIEPQAPTQARTLRSIIDAAFEAPTES